MEENQVLTDRDLLEELVRCTRKRLLYARIATAVLAAVLILLGAVVFAPNGPVARVNQMLDHAETSLARVDELSAAAANILEDNSGSLGDAVDKLNRLDVDKFNEAATNLADAARPLAGLSNLFSH